MRAENSIPLLIRRERGPIPHESHLLVGANRLTGRSEGMALEVIMLFKAVAHFWQVMP